jgi:hypothetical protein
MTNGLEFHPLANVFPLMDGEDFGALVEDIKANGLREPITLHEGKILDGRNRFRACVAAGLGEAMSANPERFFLVFDGQDPLTYVVSANLHRRNLTTQQRAAIAAELATMRSGTRTDLASNEARSPGMSDAQAAKVMGVSESSTERAKKRMRTDPEAHAKAKAGVLPRKPRPSEVKKSWDRERARQARLGHQRAQQFEEKHPEARPALARVTAAIPASYMPLCFRAVTNGRSRTGPQAFRRRIVLKCGVS